MGKREVGLDDFSTETTKILAKPGCLLVSGSLGKPNVMTIGWGLIGKLWGKDVFMVAVRPSRHTFGLIEESGEFTVNVPAKGMEKVAAYCGTKSGRDVDKFKEQGMTALASKKIGAPIIEECPINYECKVIYKEKFVPEHVPDEAKKGFYKDGDFHTIYFGEIVAVHADD
jgi:flavin reductase (DIM6/NTAB) family NADH-FMN oxidoreductase RutF